MFKFAALAAGANAAAVHHETLTYSTSEFASLGFAGADESVTFSAALPWTNFESLDEILADVSNPKSANYGKWMTQEEVNALTAPLPEHRAAAHAKLASVGAMCVDMPHSLKCAAPVSSVETLFSTRVSAYAQKTRGSKRVLRVAPETPYSFPADLAGSVSFFTSLVDFPTAARKLGRSAAYGKDGKLRGSAAGDLMVVPEGLDSFYGTATGSAASSQAPAEFQNDASFNGKDLAAFAKATGRTEWNVTHKIGPYSPNQPDLEASLDEQYMGAIGTSNDNWYWTEPQWQYEFVEAVAKAPDTAVPAVFSISWGWSEADQCTIDPAGPCKVGDKGSAAYVAMTNQGFAAAGVRGISIMVSSGDSGAHGRTDGSCSSPKTRPDWPTASPYILAVGATQIKTGTAVPIANPTSDICTKTPSGLTKCAGSGTEIVCSTATGALVVSGGGFSNVAPTPAWQKAQVTAYLAAGGILPPTGDFNSTGRGYPDVSALGHQYPILASNQWVLVDGTSCSSPVFAAVIALANSARLAAGKSTLGFVNQAIYQVAAQAGVFNDITSGDNKCTEDGCAKSCTGFGAVKSWDVPSGFGTPNIPKLVAALAAF